MTDDHLSVPGGSPETPQAEFNGRARARSNSGNSGAALDRVLAEDYVRRPSIRIRRADSSTGQNNDQVTVQEGQYVGRNRGSSAPLRMHTPGPSALACSELPDVVEETLSPTDGRPRDANSPVVRDYADAGEATQAPPVPVSPSSTINEPSASRWRPLRRARTNNGRDKATTSVQPSSMNEREYDADLVDMLDLVDPEVSTLTTLNNVQNSLFIPDLGKYLNRRPTYNLTRLQPEDDSLSSSDDGGESTKVESRATTRPSASRMTTSATLNTLTSRVNDKYYAVLPHGVSLPGWTEEEKLELNDHVRHMLHSKRSKFKRGMKGFGQYFRTPLGAFVTIYATLITLFGLAWVLFLIGWINVGGRQSYLINIIDNVLVALFAIMGDGLAPFRAVDTYHMCFIAHYHHLTWRLRREQALPKLHNKNDLPAIQPEELEAQIQNPDEETHDDVEEKAEFSVLNPNQVKKLAHHQKKFAKSHSFYKPHETATHHAFPLRLLVAIVVLLDCHSLLQIALGTCTWAISYHVRPFALTTVILCCSITCNITAGVLISVGDHKTRKKDVRERMFRQELTAEAMKQMNKRAQREMERNGEMEKGEEVKEGVLHPIGELKELESGQFGVEQDRKRREEAGIEAFPRFEEGPTPGPTPPPSRD